MPVGFNNLPHGEETFDMPKYTDYIPPDTRYCLIQDDDCHWYICPSDRRSEALEMFEAFYLWHDRHSRLWDHEDAWESLGPEPPEPDFIDRINGPHDLTFTDPKEP